MVTINDVPNRFRMSPMTMRDQGQLIDITRATGGSASGEVIGRDRSFCWNRNVPRVRLGIEKLNRSRKLNAGAQIRTVAMPLVFELNIHQQLRKPINAAIMLPTQDSADKATADRRNPTDTPNRFTVFACFE